MIGDSPNLRGLQIDGLERLIVICVGLDTAVEEAAAATTRSLLYRAVTRAQLMVAVVTRDRLWQLACLAR